MAGGGSSSLHFFGLVLSLLPLFVAPLDNGLAKTPPMGWLSWERFGCNIDCEKYPDTCISEQLYLQQAAALVAGGYRDAGYRYVNIDDCWSELERNTEGKIVEDVKRFPHGLLFLSRKLHKMGLLFGLYGDIGTKTCAGYPGYDGHFDLDAQTLAHDYEVDSIKVDGCYGDISSYNVSYPKFGAALNRTGRQILYSCSWPAYLDKQDYGENPDVSNHGIKQHCNMWRNYNDISDSWESVSAIIRRWDRRGPDDVMVRAAGPGHWNDPDMLVVGNPGLSISEQQAQFALWAIFAAPLLISADLRTIPNDSRDILLNREVIAVNQDPLGRQGWCAEEGAHTNTRVWVRELLPSSGEHCPQGQSDSWAIVLQNTATMFDRVHITFDPKLHLPHGAAWSNFTVRDLLKGRDLGVRTQFTVAVDESSVRMFKVVMVHRVAHPVQEAQNSTLLRTAWS